MDMEKNVSKDKDLTVRERLLFEHKLPAVLGKLAKKHAGRGVVTLKEHDPNDPNQNALAYHISGKPVSFEQAKQIAKGFIPGYVEALEEFSKEPPSEESKDIIKKIISVGEVIKNDGNVVVVTAHDQLADIVVALLYVRDMLIITGKDNGRTPRTVMTIVSQMVKYLNYAGVPAVDVIKLFCTDIYFSFPRTESAKDVLKALPGAMINRNNNLLRRDINEQFDQGGSLMAIAITGTTVRKYNPETNKHELAEVSSGTKKMLMHPNTSVLQLAIDVSKGFKFKAMSDLYKITTDAELDDFVSSLDDIGK